jgi:hypothetical protein
VTEEWVKAQNTPANVDADEDRWREEGALHLDRNVLERGEPARNGRTNGVFFFCGTPTRRRTFDLVPSGSPLALDPQPGRIYG